MSDVKACVSNALVDAKCSNFYTKAYFFEMIIQHDCVRCSGSPYRCETCNSQMNIIGRRESSKSCLGHQHTVDKHCGIRIIMFVICRVSLLDRLRESTKD